MIRKLKVDMMVAYIWGAARGDSGSSVRGANLAHSGIRQSRIARVTWPQGVSVRPPSGDTEGPLVAPLKAGRRPERAAASTQESGAGRRAGVFLGLLLLLSFAVPLNAAFDDIGIGARATGLGDALTANSDDAYSIVYNPAGLAHVRRPQLSSTYSRLFMGLSDGSSLQNSFLAFAHPLGPGTMGVSWNIFSLDSLYQEQTGALAYGLPLGSGRFTDDLFAGASLKLLSRTLSNVPGASQPLDANGQIVPGASDPVLKAPSRTVPDLDLGLQYAAGRNVMLGMAVKHVLEPDISFVQAGDNLGRQLRLGAGYKTPWTQLAADLQVMPAPDGTSDRFFTVAAEKWFPTLIYGEFALRGSIGTGSRDWKQATGGFSYRINRLQFDYGFALPLGSVRGTAGSHRIGLTLFFGPRVEEQDLQAAILENVAELPKGTPEYALKAQEVALYETSAARDLMALAQSYAIEGDFESALAKMRTVLTLQPNQPVAKLREQRLTVIVRFVPSLRDYRTTAWKSALYEGIVEFVYGSPEASLRRLEKAAALAPEDKTIPTLSAAVRELVRVAPEAAAPAPEEKAKRLRELSEKADAAVKALKYDEARRLTRLYLEEEPKNAEAYLRLAVADAGLQDYNGAREALDKAEGLETDDTLRSAMRSYRQSLEKLATVRPARRERPTDVEKLYEAGVELYSRGRRVEARELFKKILEAEPGNTPARRALERIESELKK